MKFCYTCHSNYRSIGVHLTTRKHVRNSMPVSRVRRHRYQHVSMAADYESRMWAEEEARAIAEGTWTK